MKLDMEVGLGPGDNVLDEDPAPPPAKGHSTQVSIHVYCGQTVAHLSHCCALGLDNLASFHDFAVTSRSTEY